MTAATRSPTDIPAAVDASASRDAIAALIARGLPKVIVLDDDPTGTQTVHDIDVLADWSVDSLSAAFAGPDRVVYLLTNTRACTESRAIAINREIAANLAAAARGRPFTVVSRGDSTLRGHYAAETGVWAGALAPLDATILIPAFFEGGRVTIGDCHYLERGGRRLPVAETEYARDATFGYTQSSLPAWVEEKTRGRVRASDVASLSLEEIREGGAKAVSRRLAGLAPGATLVVNAADYADLEIFVHALLLQGPAKRYLFRTAASFVRVLGGFERRPFLSPATMAVPGPDRGLVIVGSYMAGSSAQLARALAAPNTQGLEVNVNLLARPETREQEVARVAGVADAWLGQGTNTIIYTSRGLATALGRAGEIASWQVVSAALVAIMRRITVRPRYLITKGGITSHDIAVHGLGMRRGRVLGQAAAGLPVWRVDAVNFPDLTLIIVPGNVGEDHTLLNLIMRLGGHAGSAGDKNS